MRLRSLSVSNFRAITRLQLNDLKDTVVIAGPNGCGKSCVFDAIRLLKSVYGGYQPNEWQNWFGEFQINIQSRQADFLVLLQDRTQPLAVMADVVLATEEAAYILAHAKELLTDKIWKTIAPEVSSWGSMGATPLAANLRVHQATVDQGVRDGLPVLTNELGKPSCTASFSISPDGKLQVAPSLLLELVFSQYDPQHIGIIDFHGANRNYNREQVGGVNLNLQPTEDRLRQSALYNYANKYANLKTEMASGYVRSLIARQANPSATADVQLTATLQELFATFFPGKQFVGPKAMPNGTLLFPVRTPNGAEHDIDELSAGEKEVLYGYLRLRNAAPHNSILLIDEPELHLNPRLVAGLASFYHRHLGAALGNQLWLVTHSDTLIREAVGQQGFSVYHMQPPGQYDGPNQASPVQAQGDLDRLVIELVGDLAAYRPGAKIVVFEGGGDSEFDVRMTSTLFPRFQSSVNPISGGNKTRVAQLYDLLEATRKAGNIPGRFYAITDADSDPRQQVPVPSRFQWDVYHIENYLLEPTYILKALQDLNLAASPVDTVAGIQAELAMCARETVPGLVAHELRARVNRSMIDSLSLQFDPKRDDVAVALSEAAEKSQQRIEEVLTQQFSPAQLKREEQELMKKAEAALSAGEWMVRFRGRDVLSRFAGRHVGTVRYEPFRDLIIARMRDARHEPPGMRQVIDSILKDPVK